MSYIYDILLNFNKDYYEFYEWKKNDNIINIRKIPIIKITSTDYNILKYNEVIVEEDLIKKINGLTTTYSRTKYENCCLVSDSKRVMGLLFNNDGKIIKRSSLLLDEEEEVIEEMCDIVNTKISYKENKLQTKTNELRIEKEKKDYIIEYINKVNDELKLKYIYYDYYELDANNNADIKNILINEINNNWDKCQNKLYDLISILNKIKN